MAAPMMRLRVRASTGGPTIKLQVPLLCSLQALKDALGTRIALPSDAFSLSLNKEDEIQGPASALLSSFGITSGDLLYYKIVSDPPLGTRPQHPRYQHDADDARPRDNDQDSAAIRRLGPARTAAQDQATDTIPPDGLVRRAAELNDSADAERSENSISIDQRTGRNYPQQVAGADVPSTSSIGGGEEREVTIRDGHTDLVGSREAEHEEDEEMTTFGDRRVGIPELPLPPTSQSMAYAIDKGSFQKSSGQNVATGRQMDTTSQSDDERRRPLQLSAGPTRKGGGDLVSIPDVFRQVLTQEIRNIKKPSDCLILAVHAIMLDSGLTIRVEASGNSSNCQNDRNSFTSEFPLVGVSDGVGLHSGWSDGTGLVNLVYVLSSSARRRGREASSLSSSTGPATIAEQKEEVVLLRCQVLGDFIIVYGIVNGGSAHRLCLSISKYLHTCPDLQALARIIGEEVNSRDERLQNEENVFSNISELWREVKDNVSLPLLTSLCEKMGISPPPSLVRLPTELKIKVLDHLPAIDLARVSCVCSDFRVFSSNDELWKQKYKEEFGSVDVGKCPIGCGWKTMFVKEFEKRRRRNEDRRDAERMARNEASFTAGRRFRRNPTIAPHFGAGIDRYFHRTDGGSTRDNSAFGTMFGSHVSNFGSGDHGLRGYGGGGFGGRPPRNSGNSSLFSSQFVSPYGDGVCLPFNEISPNSASGLHLPSWIPFPPTTTEEMRPRGGGVRIHPVDTIDTRTLDNIYGGMSTLDRGGGDGVGYGGLAINGSLTPFHGRGVPIGNTRYNGTHVVPGAALGQDGRHLAGSSSYGV